MNAIIIILFALHLTRGVSIPSACPEACACQISGNDLQISCSSFNFTKLLTQKQSLLITSLNINSGLVTYIDPKLKYLKYLESLNLAGNNITFLPSQFPNLPKLKSLNLSRNHLSDLSAVDFPTNLNSLDLSYNSISYFPKKWNKLDQLEVINLENNPISCDCDNLFNYEQLIKRNVNILEATCHSPQNFFNKPLNTVNCFMITNNSLDLMLKDDVGSGDGQFRDSYFESSSLLADQEEFLSTHSALLEPNTLEEGSGDEEGSGLLIPIEEIPKACNFNCSTTKPVGIDDESDASPPPSVKEQAGIIFDDVFGTEEITTASSSTVDKPKLLLNKEMKEKEPILVTMSDKEVEVFKKNYTELGEMERASMMESNPQTVYIIVGLLMAFLVFAIIYYVNNKKKPGNNRKRNKTNENGFEEEMKPLDKPVIEKLPPNKSEESPLLNGQKNQLDDIKPKLNENIPEVELRKPNKEDLLTPQLERVTIKSGEIPDSVPKTPMLVHRQLNNDGEIVTTIISK